MTPLEAAASRVYRFLQDVARARRTTTYAAVAAAAGLDIADAARRARLARILDHINQQEHAQGRPLLSAVVCFEGGKRPGAGFYRCARALGRFHDGDRAAFWHDELERVYQTWDQPRGV